MKRIALFVGINTYPEFPLRCARADAETLYQEFSGKYNAVKLLVDREASPERIVREIERCQKVLSPGDMFLFYFSGHGCEQDGNRWIAVPQFDVQGNPLELAGLTIDALKGMTDIKGLHRLFILDCCRNVLLTESNIGAQGKMASYMHRHGSRSLIQPTILSSSAPGQTSYEHAESGHGYFTEAFLAAIRNSEVRTFNMFRDRLDCEMQNLRTPGAQDPYFEGGIGSNLPFWPTWESAVEVSSPAMASTSSTNGVSLDNVIEVLGDISGIEFYIGEKIPDGKRRNAWNSMRVRGYDSSILALYDSTFFGSSRDGFVIAKDGIYGKNFCEAPLFVPWSAIRNVSYDGGENKLVVNEHKIFVYVPEAKQSEFVECLKKLVSKATGVSMQNHQGQQGTSNISIAPNEINVQPNSNAFRLIVDDTFNIESVGYVVTGVVEGAKVFVGMKVKLLSSGYVFCSAIIEGIEKAGNAVAEGDVGDHVGLLLRLPSYVSFGDLELGMELRSSKRANGTMNRRVVDKERKIKTKKRKTAYSHVFEDPKTTVMEPEPGYVWVNEQSLIDYSVVWKPGLPHPTIEHIIASVHEGYWIPEQGYEWNGPKSVKRK